MPQVIAHHAAPAPFERFRPGRKDALGIHLGTPDQARARARHAGFAATGVLMTVRARVDNPLRLPDLQEWRPYPVWRQLKARFPHLDEATDFVPTAAGMRSIIARLGFDAVVYLNRFEAIATDAPSVGAHFLTYGPDALDDAAFARRFPAATDSFIALDRKRLEILHCHPLAPARPAGPVLR